MRRGKQFCIRKRVPLRYAAVEARREIWLGLHTDSEEVAKCKAPTIWSDQIDAWEARLDGDTQEAVKRFAAVTRLASVRGYRYLTVDKVAALPRTELLARIEAVASHGSSPHEGAAILGGVAAPPITAERALELFWDLARDEVLGKSEDQVRRWKTPRKRRSET